MNKKELQRAILKIRASDELMEEVLSMKKQRRCVKFNGRFARAAVIAAVVVALLATTAFAAPVIINALRSGNITTDGTLCVEPTGGREGQWNMYEVRVDVDMNDNAPVSIEHYYVPVLDAGYVQYYGFVYKDRMSACYMWTNGEENWEDEVRFWQDAGGTYDPEDVQTVVCAQPGVTPEEKLVNIGEIEGYLVENPDLYGTRCFIWSDGEYLFKLEVPDEYTDADIAGVLRSIVCVDDILPYCVSMSMEEIKAILG